MGGDGSLRFASAHGSCKARGRLLSHLAVDEALNEPEIDHLTLVAVVDAILLDDRLFAV